MLNAEGRATPTELRMSRLWSEVLGVNNLSPAADFFDLGGQSLNGVRLLSKIRAECGVDVPIVTLFDSPPDCCKSVCAG